MDHDPEDGGEFVVLKTAWCEEFHQPVVYYYDKAAALADGKCKEDLMDDLQHRSVHYSNVHDVVRWINGEN